MARTGERSAGARMTARAAGLGAADILNNITNGNAAELPAALATSHRNAACLTAHTRRRAPGITPCASNPHIPREQPGKEVDTYGMD